MLNNAVDDNFDLFYENAPAGHVHLSSTFAPEGGDQYENLKAKYEEQNVRLEAELAEAKEQAAKLEEKSK